MIKKLKKIQKKVNVYCDGQVCGSVYAAGSKPIWTSQRWLSSNYVDSVHNDYDWNDGDDDGDDGDDYFLEAVEGMLALAGVVGVTQGLSYSRFGY